MIPSITQAMASRLEHCSDARILLKSNALLESVCFFVSVRFKNTKICLNCLNCYLVMYMPAKKRLILIKNVMFRFLIALFCSQY